MTTATEVQAAAAARRDRIIEYTRKGFSASLIADIEKVTPRSVFRIRHQTGMSQGGPPKPLTEDELATAASMLDDGCSIAEVARTLGRHYPTLAKYFPGRGWSKEDAARFAAWSFRMSQRIQGFAS